MGKSVVLALLCLGFIVGISLGQLAYAKLLVILGAVIVAAAVLSKRYLLVGAVILAIFLGSVRYKLHISYFPIEKYDSQVVSFRGWVAEDPERKQERTNLVVSIDNLNAQNFVSKIMVVTAVAADFNYGDELSGRGKISIPRSAPGEFSYREYLRRYGIEAVINYPGLNRSAGARRGSRLKHSVIKVKSLFNRQFEVLPEPESSFLKGILIGDKAGFSEEMQDRFSRTGTSHLVAVSGFNITVIALALSKVLANFGKKIVFAGSIVSIVFFVMLTGASASVVRAGIMGSLFLLAQNAGRLYGITNALVVAAVIMLIQNPLVLRFDLGFQLSFLALTGIVYLSPIFEKFFWPRWKPVTAVLFPTIAAQIATFPIVAQNFGQTSLIAPVTNIVVLPLIPLGMLLGFAAGVLSLIVDSWAGIFFAPVWLVLRFMLEVIDFTAQIPGSSVNFTPPAWLAWVMYLGLVMLVVLFNKISRANGKSLQKIN